MAANVEDVTDAIVAGLATATGKSIGDGEAPADTTFPYGMVRHIPGGRVFSNIDHGHQHSTVTYQLEGYGSTAKQAGWMGSKLRAAVLDLSNFTPPTGFVFTHVVEELDNGVARDDDEGTEPTFRWLGRYSLTVVSA